MSIALQAAPADAPVTSPAPLDARVAVDGKFLRAGDERFLVKGVTYGTFAPDSSGYQFPAPAQIAEDFRLMAGPASTRSAPTRRRGAACSTKRRATACA